MKLIFFIVPFLAQLSFAGNLWKSLPVQNSGRIKPFDTLARETLFKVYGKECFKSSFLDRKPAVDVLISWIMIPHFWDKTEFILIKNSEVKKSLGLDVRKKYFSPLSVLTNQKWILGQAELQALRQRKVVLDSYFKNLEKLETQLQLYNSVKVAWLIQVQPQEGLDRWLALAELKSPEKEIFQQVLSSYVEMVSAEQTQIQKKEKKQQFKTDLAQFKEAVFDSDEKKWYSPSRIHSEIFYNSFKPFRVAWVFYLLSLLVLLILSNQKKFGFVLYGVGFLSHLLGLVLRSYIMIRPPVSNMYETVVWVPFVALIAGLFFYLKKKRQAFFASLFVAVFSLFLTDVSSEILNGSLQPLEAVLRSHFWLSTHVLIITMSYAFFFLAFAIGDWLLLKMLFKKSLKVDSEGVVLIYRVIQWAVVLLFVGTVLGAIWADYSWGRFWGWDPKESWALISLLGYLALVHGKFTGWIQPLGFVISSVLMFFLVIMAWYGVNFVLGKGLHSYGFGSGGVEFVLGFLALHLALCAGVLFQRSRLRS